MKSLLISVALVFSSLASAQDQEGKANYAGLLLGYSVIVSGDGGNEFMYAARLGRSVHLSERGDFAVGLFLGRLSSSLTVNNTEVAESITALSIDLIARRAFGTGLYYGGRFGLGLVRATIDDGANKVSGSGNSALYGPVIGFEFPIDDQFSINLDTSWLTLSGGTLAITGVGETEYDSSSAVTLQVGAIFNW